MYHSLKVLFDFPYNQKRPFAAFGRLVEWKFIRLLKVKKYKKRFWKDRFIYLSHDSFQSMWLMYHCWVDWEEFNLIGLYLDNNKVFFDIGSNIGFYSLWASKFIEQAGAIHAFEPDKKNFLRLTDNLKINQLETKVTINQKAVSDSNGPLDFSIGLDGENHILMESIENATKVEAVTLDHYCHTKNICCIDYLKVDVEGFELMVIKGAKSLLEHKKIKIIQLEINTTLANSKTTAQELINYLNGFGYFLCQFDVDKAQLMPIQYTIHRENYFLVFDMDVLSLN